MSKKRVVFIDDHALVRIGIRALLDTPMALQQYGYRLEVVVEARDGIDGWQAVQRHRPDLVLLDINLPRLNGYEVLKRIRSMQPRPKVLVLSTQLGTLPVRRALDAGADGVLYKTEDPVEMLRGIDAVLAGFCFVPRDAVRAFHPQLQDISRLSPRERCIAEQLINGRSNKSIADSLCLSAKTVSAHKRNVLRKLAVNNVIELADYLRHTDAYGIDVDGRSGPDGGVQLGERRCSAFESSPRVDAIGDGDGAEGDEGEAGSIARGPVEVAA